MPGSLSLNGSWMRFNNQHKIRFTCFIGCNVWLQQQAINPITVLSGLNVLLSPAFCDPILISSCHGSCPTAKDTSVSHPAGDRYHPVSLTLSVSQAVLFKRLREGATMFLALDLVLWPGWLVKLLFYCFCLNILCCGTSKHNCSATCWQALPNSFFPLVLNIKPTNSCEDYV